FGLAGGETFLAFDLSVAAVLAARSRREFFSIALEVIIDSSQFAAEIILLPPADGRQMGFQLFDQRGAQHLLPKLRFGRRPNNRLWRFPRQLSEIEAAGQRFVGLAVGQGNGQAMEGPMLIDGLAPHSTG